MSSEPSTSEPAIADRSGRVTIDIADGEAIFGPAIARRVIEFFAAGRAHRPLPELTEREREVLELVAAGLGNHEIARRLVLSEKTVRNHVSAILVKLQVPDRASAVAKARDAGLGTNPQQQTMDLS